MEICFETKTVKSFRESLHQIKRTQLSMESVVPDVNDDIGRLFSIQPSILLKSKDLTTRGASVTGELTVALLYINELENAVYDLHFTQSFSLDFDMAEPDPDLLTQIRLFVSHAEARALNPRKVSVTVEVGGELSGYTQEESKVAVSVPSFDQFQIFTRQNHATSALINAVTEKTFVINEQFPFPSGKPVPERLVSEKLDFNISDRQLIGSKVLMKGTVCVSICYLSESTDYPVSTVFSAPFSQLVDIGQESMDSCSVRIEPTSVYYSLIDMISGEKALDAEIHAVAQIVSRFQQEIDTLSDAYAVRYPSELSFESWPLVQVGAPERLLLEADEKIELPEDCVDVLSVMPTLGQCSMGQGKAEINVSFDVLYRSAGGSLSSARRMLTLSSDCPAQAVSLRETRLLDPFYRPEGNLLNVRLSVELYCEQRAETEAQSVVSLSLDEDSPYNEAQFPSVTAVRADGESIWDLAKQYHSSCERIESLNEIDGPIRGKMLLIPKCF